jgi:hypothetical protein
MGTAPAPAYFSTALCADRDRSRCLQCRYYQIIEITRYKWLAG